MIESPDPFQQAFSAYFDTLRQRVSTNTGDWTVKGFINIHQQIYTISIDTKVLSKVMELLMFPVIVDFAHQHRYKIVLARQQNQYPDISLMSPEGIYYALDIKTTYRTGADRNEREKVSGMTLGTFGGYFRSRNDNTISTFAYSQYAKHYVLGVVYSRLGTVDERATYPVAQLADIPSVVRDFQFFLHEKYRIASDRPGSGNTKNIGSTQYLDRLISGTGVFAHLGVEIFDDYWMNYRTKAMAREEGYSQPPYRNLLEYKQFKQQGSSILMLSDDEIVTEDDVD
jgi:hypothetical protein